MLFECMSPEFNANEASLRKMTILRHPNQLKQETSTSCSTGKVTLLKLRRNAMLCLKHTVCASWSIPRNGMVLRLAGVPAPAHDPTARPRGHVAYAMARVSQFNNTRKKQHRKHSFIFKLTCTVIVSPRGAPMACSHNGTGSNGAAHGEGCWSTVKRTAPAARDSVPKSLGCSLRMR